MKRGLLFLAVLLMGFAVKGVAQADGEYYLYNEATKMFLSRGEDYGTRAIVDKYGIPVAWNATDASLKVLDSNTDKGKDFLFQTGTTIYTDGVSTGFAFEETADGYYLKSNQSGSYLTLADGKYRHQVVALTTEASAATVWQLKTKAEHDAIVGEYANRNLENVATAAGLNVSADAFVTTLGSLFMAVDMTASIGTAKFTDGAGDWTFTGIRSQKDQPKYGADFCELWQATGYYTQTITGLAEGIYKVTVNALERSGDAAACVTMGQKGYEITTASLIANTEEVALKSWYGERSSDTWPNKTNEAISDFAAGKYLNEVYTYVGADGELKLTLAKPGYVANNWVIFNNFTLTYYEKNNDILVKADTLMNAQTDVAYKLTESFYNGAKYWLHYKAEKDGILTVTPSTKTSVTLNLYNNEGKKYSTSNSDLVQDYTVGFRTKGFLAGDEVYIEVAMGSASVETPGTVTLTFAEGTPYSPITLSNAQPAEGEVYSTALTYGSTKAGVATYTFSGKVSLTDLVASVKIGEKVYPPLTLNTGTSSTKVNLQSLPDTIKAAKEAGLLKAGESFTVTLSNICDANYAVNTVADQSFTYTLASTACTGVTPAVSGKKNTFPESTVFAFDGAVSLEGAKVYFVNTATAEQTEITTATVEGSSVTVPLPAVTTLLPPKKFSVVIEGLKDESGNILTYPADGEEGKVVAAYEMNDYLLKLESCTPERNASVFSLKTFDLKFNAPVQYSGNAIKVTYLDMGAQDYVDAATCTVTVDEADPTKVTITLDKEITEANDYNLDVPSKTFVTADGYFASSMSYSYTVLPFGIKSSVPANESIVLSLSELELTFSADAALVEKGTTVSLKNEDGEEVAVGTLKEDTEDYDVINVEFDKTIDTKGTYTVTIPAGVVKEYDGENVNSEVTYTINVDPEYWDPSWVIDLPGGSDYEENPTELIAGRKYNIAESGTTYVTYTATETGRLYFNTNYNQLTTIRLTDGPEKSWYLRKTLNGTQDEETGNYSYWMGVQAGETYYITFYYYGKSRIFDLVFEAGQPYEPLVVTQTSHKDGDLYSRAIRTELTYQYGAVDFRFNAGINVDVLKAYVILPSKDNAKIDVTSKNKIGTGNLYYGVCLGDTIEAIKEKYELKAGDKIQVVLENVQDQDFADNKLAENPSVELTLAGIVCSFVYPYEDNAQESVPSEIELTFDGEVVYGTGYVLDLQTNEKTDIPAANFVLGEPTTDHYNITSYPVTLTLPEVTLSSTTKKFAIVFEDLKDKDGNVITGGEIEGKFALTYSLTDDRFVIVSSDLANGAEVTSLQTIKFTFADNVNLATGENAPYLTDNEDFEMKATLSVDANDPKTVIMTLEEAVTTPGEYHIVLPQGWIYNSLYDASKEDLGLADGAIYNPYYTSSVIIPTDFSDITVTKITPDIYYNTNSTVEELPAEIVVTFSAAVKEITAVYGLGSGGATPYAMEEIPEGTDALTATIDGEKVKIQVPADVIAANTYGEYQIVLGVVDAEGKAVGANPNDSYDGHVVLSYYIQPSLKLVSYTPEGENLEKVEKIVLTFSTDVYPEYAPSGANMWMGDIELTDAEGNAVGGELTYTFSGKEVTITPTTALTEKGAYKLSIPEEMFYEGTYDPEDWYTTYLYNKEINLNFFVQMTNPAVANLTTAVAEAKAWIATLDATNVDHAEVIALVNPLIEEGEAILADLNNSTLEEIQAQADALNEAVSAWRERFEKQALAEELQTLLTEASEVYAFIDETIRTDEAGLQDAIQSAEKAIRYVNWGTLEDLKIAKTTLEEALAAFKAENNQTDGIDIDAAKDVVAVKYFTLNGVELTEPVEGVIVKKTLYADGTVNTVKMVVKK